MQIITMWCPRCELWTKEYNRTGQHDCGAEVLSTGIGDQPDLEFEGNEKELHAIFKARTFRIAMEIVYDHQRLAPGDQVERVEDWKKAPEGHYIARFKTNTGEEIPLIMDEVLLDLDKVSIIQQAEEY